MPPHEDAPGPGGQRRSGFYAAAGRALYFALCLAVAVITIGFLAWGLSL